MNPETKQIFEKLAQTINEPYDAARRHPNEKVISREPEHKDLARLHKLIGREP